MVAWLCVSVRVQICICPSRCHCHSLSRFLVPAHPSSPRQSPGGHETIVVVCVYILGLLWSAIIPQSRKMVVVCVCVCVCVMECHVIVRSRTAMECHTSQTVHGSFLGLICSAICPICHTCVYHRTAMGCRVSVCL